MVGASKKFIDPATYQFRLAPIYTFDGGQTWHESQLPIEPGWNGMTDPTVAFDDFGHAFLVGEPLPRSRPISRAGHGRLPLVRRRCHVGAAVPLHHDDVDDKQWVLCDNNPGSPHYGNVYVAWAANTPLRFARSTDHGGNWKGKGTDPPGTTIAGLNAFAPDISISADGTLHIFWHMDGADSIQYLRSTDGGATFEPVRTIVTGVSSLRGHLPLLTAGRISTTASSASSRSSRVAPRPAAW